MGNSTDISGELFSLERKLKDSKAMTAKFGQNNLDC